ncbi:hypothetical protein DFH09DRAFT_1498136 [Mycena vulgaris]|nr:hypothetical protein DFH09DRAFT_1498136 [Mycena vulgaris]
MCFIGPDSNSRKSGQISRIEIHVPNIPSHILYHYGRRNMHFGCSEGCGWNFRLFLLFSSLAPTECLTRLEPADGDTSKVRIESLGIESLRRSRQDSLCTPSFSPRRKKLAHCSSVKKMVQPSVVQLRLNKVIEYLATAVATLEKVSTTFDTPYLAILSTTVRSLLVSVQTVRRNKDDCARMMEQIHELLYPIIALHINSDSGGELSPTMLQNIGQLTETLHKIQVFVEAQQDRGILKQFFRQGEMSALLKVCNLGLQQALDAFKVQRINILSDVIDMQINSEKLHQEVLELIASLSDVTSSDRASTINTIFSGSRNSSSSLSLLPSEPKIFHGRESELSAIMETFSQQVPRIAILGAGGMGKTSVARAVLYHSDITARYNQHRFFVACDSVLTPIELSGLIGSYLGLKPGKNLTRAVANWFSRSPPSLLILDNLETLWEPQESRADIEEFLSLLADIDHLALIITMRGAERPAKVRWTRPFLAPLKTLKQDAARQTFIDITDDFHDHKDIDKLLLLTGNLPLAIDIIAHLADYEGCSNVLARWEKERTSLLSDGCDRRSNLDLSISLSLSSPRFTALPHAKDLLSLLSLLPDGLSDIELLQSQLPITDVFGCRTALLRTSLAYADDQGRLKAMVPIREYMQKLYPPIAQLIHPLLQHFQKLLEVHKSYFGTLTSRGIVPRITLNFGNIQNILLSGLHPSNPDLVDTVYCALSFETFSRLTNHHCTVFKDHILRVLPMLHDHELEVTVITQLFESWRNVPVSTPEALVEQGLHYLKHVGDHNLQSRFYHIIGAYYLFHDNDIPAATNFCQTALSLAMSTGNTKRQADVQQELAWIKWRMGDYSGSQIHAYESQRLAKMSGNLYREADALEMEGMCWGILGNYSHALALFTRASELLGLCGMPDGHLYLRIMGDLGEVHRLKSEYIESRAIQDQVLRKILIEEQPYLHAYTLLEITELDLAIGRPSQDVQRNIDTVRSIFSTVGYSRGGTWCDSVQASLNLREGNFLDANILFQKCLTASRGQYADLATGCLERLGDGSHWCSIKWTDAWTTVFLVHVLKLKQKLEIYKAVQFLAGAFLAQGDSVTAVSLLTVALEGFTNMDVHRSRAECMLKLGEISAMDGDLSKATELWKTAKPLFERSSQSVQATHIDLRLATVPQEDNIEHLRHSEARIVRTANEGLADILEPLSCT